MRSTTKCAGRCTSCINRFVSSDGEGEPDKGFCEMFNYNYEAITLENATKVLMNPRQSVLEKRVLIAILQSNSLDPAALYKDGKIPAELIL